MPSSFTDLLEIQPKIRAMLLQVDEEIAGHAFCRMRPFDVRICGGAQPAIEEQADHIGLRRRLVFHLAKVSGIDAIRQNDMVWSRAPFGSGGTSIELSSNRCGAIAGRYIEVLR